MSLFAVLNFLVDFNEIISEVQLVRSKGQIFHFCLAKSHISSLMALKPLVENI